MITCAEHEVTPKEAEHVVRNARRPYPLGVGGDRFLVVGKDGRGRLLHVIFVVKDLDDVEAGSMSLIDLPDDVLVIEVVLVIHAMPASDKLKRHDRRRRKK